MEVANQGSGGEGSPISPSEGIKIREGQTPLHGTSYAEFLLADMEDVNWVEDKYLNVWETY